MKTFLDESGSFAKATSSSISIIGALTCRSHSFDSLCAQFEVLKQSWGLHGEPTGGKLNEKEVIEVVDLLLKHDAYFHVVVTDTSQVSDRDFTELRQMHIDGLYRHLTPQHNAMWRGDVDELARFLAEFSFPSLIQFCLLTHLLDRILRDFLLWHAAKTPTELSSFDWILDAKDVTHTTKEEKTWRSLVGAYLQNRSLEHPIFLVRGLDYSHMSRFWTVPSPGLVEKFPQMRKDDPAIDVGSIVRDNLSFKTSSSELGLQMVHIITNAYRRVLVGNIDAEQVKSLGQLMMKSRKFAAETVIPKSRAIPPKNLSADVEQRFLLLERQAEERLRKGV
jgi:hypothetical protein